MKAPKNDYLSSLANPHSVESLSGLINFSKPCPVEEHAARSVVGIVA
jgi:hypothetical protein